MTPHVRLLVGRSIGPLVCHNFLKGREVAFSYRSTCYKKNNNLDRAIAYNKAQKIMIRGKENKEGFERI